jgi:gluconolactonase
MKPAFFVYSLSVLAAVAASQESYPVDPARIRHEGVPSGTLEKFSFADSKIFPGTERDYWIYVPAQYGALPKGKSAALMVYQDGGGRISEKSDWRVPIVFDNLIHAGEMPVTIGVFVNPGVVPAPHAEAQPRYNRSFEYDGMGDRYARFLIEELLPVVEKKYRVSADPNDRAIAGSSSGAIAAWTVAWERPDSFRRVFSTVGTFVGLRAGDEYPTLIRKHEPKPIRVFLQDGSNDNNIYGGSWWHANQSMLSALEFSGYEVNHVWGEGGHNGKHGGAVMPDALRWLWKDWPRPVQAGLGAGHKLSDILVPGEDWELVSQGHKFTEGPAVNSKGELFFTDIPESRIWKVALDGKVSLFASETGGGNGLMFGPNGKLYCCQMQRGRVVCYDENGRETVLLDKVKPNDLTIDTKGGIYVSSPGEKRIYHIDAKGRSRIVDKNNSQEMASPNGVLLSPDQTLLLAADYRGRFVWSYQVQPDGSLKHKQPYHHLHMPDDATGSFADGMTCDRDGRLYVATALGIQMCDQPGRVNAIINKPQAGPLSNVVFGGPELDILYATCGDKVFKRRVKVRGVRSYLESVKPPKPRL